MEESNYYEDSQIEPNVDPNGELVNYKPDYDNIEKKINFDNEKDINVQVCDPIIKEGLKNYVVYTVKGSDKEGPFEVYRRYSEFVLVRQTMVNRWPGCYVPPLPPKKPLVFINFLLTREISKKIL